MSPNFHRIGCNSTRRISLTAILIMAALTVWAHSMAQAGQDKFATLAMSLTPLSAPVIIAAEKGYFAKHGVTMTINGFVGGHRSMKAMLGGQAHMATSSEAVVMFQSFRAWYGHYGFIRKCSWPTGSLWLKKESNGRSVQKICKNQ